LIIRPTFLVEWCELKRSEWHHRADLIDDRNRQLKELNRKFGFVDEDQCVPIGKRTSTHPGYGRAYDSIETDFHKVYDALSGLEGEWLRKNAATIEEYLVMDNLELGASRFFVEQLSKNCHLHALDVIGLRARSLFIRWTDEFRLNGVTSQLQIEKQHFPYAERRCRRFFGIRGWPRDRGKNAQITDYRHFYFEKLDREFDWLKVQLP
jgi:hypothetical protein